MPTQNKPLIIGLVVVIAAGAVFLVRYFKSQPAAEAPQEENTAANAPQGNDLGTELYAKSNNPIAEKLPETAAPVANPIEGMYKNPFE